jgi:amidophosphoribosyltransferase
MDKPKCNCGIFGIIGTTEAAHFTFYGLHSLQHRGQEASGIVTLSKGENNKPIFNYHKDLGYVSEVYSKKDVFEKTLIGDIAIGHNRYSTTGSSASIKNIQPFLVNYRLGNLAVAHNGNLTNASKLRKELVDEGAIFQTTSDTEVILHLIARSKLTNQIDQIKEAINKIEGAFSLLILTDNYLIGVRDKYGFRPLCLGKSNGSLIITSETCALDINKAEYIRDVEPGEMVVLKKNELNEVSLGSHTYSDEIVTKKHCVFEFIYFSRPDSRIFGTNVDKIRRKLGKILAQNHPVVDKDGDKVIVISVPDSSNTVAIGFQNHLSKMGIPSKLEIGLIRSHYVGRTFILPGQRDREIGVRIKFNTVKGVLEGKTVVLVDDSIVRGTTSKLLIKLIKEANPKEIHLRISSPPIISPCFYGMDFPSPEELIANLFHQNIEEIRNYLEVDSLHYLTEAELLEAMVGFAPEEFCTACFTGKYPVNVDMMKSKEVYEN